MNRIQSALRHFAAAILRRRARGVRSIIHEPASIAQYMDATNLHDILRSAEAGNTSDLFCLYRDIIAGHGHTQAEFTKRKLAVLSQDITDPGGIQPYRAKDPADVAAAEYIKRIIGDIPAITEAVTHLLDSAIYPVSLVEKTWRPGSNGRRFDIAALTPVPYDLLDYTAGHMRIRDIDPLGNPLSTFHTPDPARYIIHRGHLLTSVPDTWGGPMRAVTFWWLFATMGRDWWARFTERFGSPFLVGRYEDSDDRARSELEVAFSAAQRLFGLVISRETEIEVHEVAASGHADAFEKFHSVANREISKIIVGQTLSAEGQNLGFGGGQASAQENVRDDYRAWDSQRLAVTLREQLFRPILDANGIPGNPPKISFGAQDETSLTDAAPFLTAITSAGLELTDDAIATLGSQTGYQLRRAVRPPAPQFSALSVATPPPRTPRETIAAASRDASDAVAAAATPDMLAAFSGTLAPVRQIILDSTSPDDLTRKLTAFYADWSPGRVAPILENALVAWSANATLSHRP